MKDKLFYLFVFCVLCNKMREVLVFNKKAFDIEENFPVVLKCSFCLSKLASIMGVSNEKAKN